MGRIRTVKPEFFTHEDLHDLGRESGFGPLLRLAFAGLWTQCDREGRFKWRPRSLSLAILPYDDVDFGAILDCLESAGYVRRYEVHGKAYGWVPSFLDHQHINARETGSTLPPHPEDPRGFPENDPDSTGGPRVDDACISRHDLARGEGNGREGKGTERNAGRRPLEKQNRWPGSSMEWDESLRLMDEMGFDARAMGEIEASRCSDIVVLRALKDAKQDRRIHKKAGWALSTLRKCEEKSR